MLLRSDHFCDTMSARVRINPSHNQPLCDVWLPRGLGGKEAGCRCRRHELDPWLGKIPWRRKWQLTPVFLPHSHSLVYYVERTELGTQRKSQITGSGRVLSAGVWNWRAFTSLAVP